MASRTFALCADMGPPTNNHGPPGATSGGKIGVFRLTPDLGPRAQKSAKKALLGPPTEKSE